MIRGQERERGGVPPPAAVAWMNAYGLIVRQRPEIICKVDRDQRSGVRDQKRNELGCSGVGDFQRGDLTASWGAPFVETVFDCYTSNISDCEPLPFPGPFTTRDLIPKQRRAV